jgi:hypothetical protein
MCRSTARRWSPASCSRTSARRCTPRPTRRCTTPSSSSTCACPPPAACRCRCCPRRSTACASSASTCRVRRAHPRRGQGRAGRRHAALRAHRGRGRPGAGAAQGRPRHKPTVTLLGEMFPADPMIIGMMLEPMGLAAGPVVPTREWRELYAALDCTSWPRSTRSTPPACASSSRRPPRGGLGAGGPRRHRSLAAGHRQAANVAQARSTPPRTASCRPSRGRWRRTPIKGRITLSGYEGSELLVAACWSKAAPTCATWARPARARLERRRPRLAGSARRAGAVPRLAGAGPGRDA